VYSFDVVPKIGLVSEMPHSFDEFRGFQNVQKTFARRYAMFISLRKTNRLGTVKIRSLNVTRIAARRRRYLLFWVHFI